MKHFITIIIFVLASTTSLLSQIPTVPTIDNKGNHTQTYPNVTTVNSAVQALVNQVNIVNLEDDIRYMQNLGIRGATSPVALQTQNWLVDKLESFGLDVYIHRFIYDLPEFGGDTLQAGNVVAIKQGTEFPDQYIIISSHYDSVDTLYSSWYGGPGADDNASGTAGVIECARILSQIETKRSIMFVPFNAEELIMVGSSPFAIKCAQENMNILGVFNLDMLGFYPAEGYGNIKMFAGSAAILNKLFFEYYTQVANLYLPDVPTLLGTNHGGADDGSFNLNDYPALYIGDVEYINENHCYHRPCDTIGEFGGVNNMSLVKAYTQATLAAVAELANGWLPPQNFSAVSGIDKVTLSWDDMPETMKYKVYKNSVLLTETTSNFYIDNDVIIGETYSYFVKGIRKGNNEESYPSNIDSIVFSLPLTIPYLLDLNGNREELKYWGYRNWRVYNSNLGRYLAPVQKEPPFSILELDGFPIPENTTNLSLRIIAQDDSNNPPYMTIKYWFIEVTSDRKTWHKLAKNIDFNTTKPDTLAVSLNEFIGSPFFQLRVRLGASGRGDIGNIRIFSLVIDNTSVSIKENEKITYLNNFQIYPNPASGIITVKTESESSYALAVYDIYGKKIFQENSFRDGTLNLSTLPKGNYLIQVSQNNHQMAKKIIVQ
jgi:hypothetical protein